MNRRDLPYPRSPANSEQRVAGGAGKDGAGESSSDAEAPSSRQAMNLEIEAQRHNHDYITRLKLEAEAASREAKRLATLNRLLANQVTAAEDQLLRITGSIGWRLLQRYGRFKYRYLLPVYRLLGLHSGADSMRSPSRPTTTPVEEPLVEGAIPDDVNGGSATSERETSSGTDSYASLMLLPEPRKEDEAWILNSRPDLSAPHRHDVVCFSIIDWEFRYQRPQQIMSQFAAHGHRVFYISTSRFLSPGDEQAVRVNLIKENVYEVNLKAAGTPRIYGEVIEGHSSSAVLDSLDALRRDARICMAVGYVMIASWSEIALEAAKRWNWSVVYDCMDEWQNFPGIARNLVEVESSLVNSADLLVVTAQRLLDKWDSRSGATVLARNAADFDFYQVCYRPNTLLTEIQHPIVGYYGAIADWFDVELLEYVAGRRPGYTFVLLGGIFDVDLSSLKRLSNIHFLGQQPYETMPLYLYHFDACMIPFKVNPITEATDPVKLYEYLSAGKPVVSVGLPELSQCREHLYIAGNKDEFVEHLDRALAEDDIELVARRRAFAQRHTWKSRYEQIEAGIVAVIKRASIVVVTYNNLALTRLCLESIIRNTQYPNFEIIVVDNNSTDGTPSYLRYLAARFPQLSVILNSSNLGFARANNQGIRRSTGDYLILLNNDTVVPPGWLSRLLDHLRSPEVGLVGPVTNFVGNEAKIDAPYNSWSEMEAFADEHVWAHDGRIADIHMLAMFCVALRREVFEAVGPLDEQFGIGMFEDDDYSRRVKEKGYRVACAADVFVHHFGQAAFKALIRSGEYDTLFAENQRRYETKWNVKWKAHRHGQLKFKRSGATNAESEEVIRKEEQEAGDL